MPNSVRTRAITSRCQDEDEDKDEELQIIHGSVDGEGARISKDKNLPKVHIISLVSLALLTIIYHGE